MLANYSLLNLIDRSQSEKTTASPIYSLLKLLNKDRLKEICNELYIKTSKLKKNEIIEELYQHSEEDLLKNIKASWLREICRKKRIKGYTGKSLEELIALLTTKKKPKAREEFSEDEDSDSSSQSEKKPAEESSEEDCNRKKSKYQFESTMQKKPSKAIGELPDSTSYSGTQHEKKPVQPKSLQELIEECNWRDRNLHSEPTMQKKSSKAIGELPDSVSYSGTQHEKKPVQPKSSEELSEESRNLWHRIFHSESTMQKKASKAIGQLSEDEYFYRSSYTDTTKDEASRLLMIIRLIYHNLLDEELISILTETLRLLSGSD